MIEWAKGHIGLAEYGNLEELVISKDDMENILLALKRKRIMEESLCKLLKHEQISQSFFLHATGWSRKHMMEYIKEGGE